MKMTVMPKVIGILGSIHKGLVQGLEDLEISGDHPDNSITKIGQNSKKKTCCYSDSSERPSTNAGMKNSQRSKIKITIMATSGFCCFSGS